MISSGLKNIPIADLLALGMDDKLVATLRFSIEIEERGKVVATYDFDIVAEGLSILNRAAMQESYNQMVAVYRARLFSRLDQEFRGRYPERHTPNSGLASRESPCLQVNRNSRHHGEVPSMMSTRSAAERESASHACQGSAPRRASDRYSCSTPLSSRQPIRRLRASCLRIC